MCEYCKQWKDAETVYQTNPYCDLAIGHFGSKPTLLVKNIRRSCPPYADCSAKGLDTNVSFLINYCPNCGEQLMTGGTTRR